MNKIEKIFDDFKQLKENKKIKDYKFDDLYFNKDRDKLVLPTYISLEAPIEYIEFNLEGYYFKKDE